MSTQAVKDTLADENGLLEEMIKLVQGYPADKITKQADYIRRSWARFLEERHDTNAKLALRRDDELQEDLKSEMEQVEAYIRVTDQSPDYSEQWSKFLVCERDILLHLLKMCEGKSAP